jgi:hypothetical protein
MQCTAHVVVEEEVIVDIPGIDLVRTERDPDPLRRAAPELLKGLIVVPMQRVTEHREST